MFVLILGFLKMDKEDENSCETPNIGTFCMKGQNPF